MKKMLIEKLIDEIKVDGFRTEQKEDNKRGE